MGLIEEVSPCAELDVHDIWSLEKRLKVLKDELIEIYEKLEDEIHDPKNSMCSLRNAIFIQFDVMCQIQALSIVIQANIFRAIDEEDIEDDEQIVGLINEIVGAKVKLTSLEDIANFINPPSVEEENL